MNIKLEDLTEEQLQLIDIELLQCLIDESNINKLEQIENPFKGIWI